MKMFAWIARHGLAEIVCHAVGVSAVGLAFDGFTVALGLAVTSFAGMMVTLALTVGHIL